MLLWFCDEEVVDGAVRGQLIEESEVEAYSVPDEVVS